jgi:3-methyladenine DNA glycosylase AlkD
MHMTVEEVMTQLEALGSEQIKNIYANHGNVGHVLGVRIGDMKPIVKKLKGAQETALELFETGCMDAMYLAGLVADGAKMSKEQLERWAHNSTYSAIAENTVAWVAAESAHARELALKWIDSAEERVATTGWHTYDGILALWPDEQIDKAEVEALLERVEKTIHDSENRVRACMNGFIINVGTYAPSLVERAKQAAARIGKVQVDLGKTSCKVPDAIEYIEKVEKMGRTGKKRKTMKC